VGLLVTTATGGTTRSTARILGIYGIGPSPVFITPPTGSALGEALYNADVADLDTIKVGGQLVLPTPSAHYDLGAGGRGATTDCHDANSNPPPAAASAPICTAGPAATCRASRRALGTPSEERPCASPVSGRP
jgi:hypothetical protein